MLDLTSREEPRFRQTRKIFSRRRAGIGRKFRATPPKRAQRTAACRVVLGRIHFPDRGGRHVRRPHALREGEAGDRRRSRAHLETGMRPADDLAARLPLGKAAQVPRRARRIYLLLGVGGRRRHRDLPQEQGPRRRRVTLAQFAGRESECEDLRSHGVISKKQIPVCENLFIGFQSREVFRICVYFKSPVF